MPRDGAAGGGNAGSIEKGKIGVCAERSFRAESDLPAELPVECECRLFHGPTLTIAEETVSEYNSEMEMSPKQPRFLPALAYLSAMGFFLWYQVRGIGPLTAQVFDGDGLIGGLNQAQSELSGTGIREESNLVIVIVAVINAVLPYAAIAAFIAFVVSGFLFILGFGSETAVQRAKKIMIWSAVGLVVIIFSFVLTSFIIATATA
jgi:hypothetical protein